jgi:hypothetical protein
VYTQVELPPLIPPYKGGKKKSSSLPFIRGGLGWGNSRTGSDSIICVYTVAYVEKQCRDVPMERLYVFFGDVY